MFRVSWSPASQFEKVYAAHPDNWNDYLVMVDAEFAEREKAEAYIDRFADRALHGHFTLTEFERDERDDEIELGRETIER